MNDIAENIEGAEKLTSIFGRWPSFHDAETVNFNLWRGDSQTAPTLTLQIHLWKMTSEVDQQNHFVLKHHTLATLRFHSIEDLEADGFNFQNVTSDLYIQRKERTDGPSPYFDVNLGQCFGLNASFTCLRIEIVDARECDKDEKFGPL